MNTSEDEAPNRKPEWHLKAGALDVACWKAMVSSEEGGDREFLTVTSERAYKDKNGQWQHTQSLRRQDLLPMARLLEQAYDKLSVANKDEE